MEWVPVWVGVNFAIGYMIGKSKDQALGSAFLCVFLGPLGWIAALLSEGSLRHCPHCAEKVKQAAKVCRYCRSELPLAPQLLTKLEKKPAATGSVIASCLFALAALVTFGLCATERMPRIVAARAALPVPATPTPVSVTPEITEIVENSQDDLARRMGFTKQQIVEMKTRKPH